MLEETRNRRKAAVITISRGNKSGLPANVRKAIGERPIIQLTLSLDGTQAEWNNPNAPVKVTMPYTPTAEELENPECIIVRYIDALFSSSPTADYIFQPNDYSTK